jgi:hypothetical protein
VYPAFNQLRQLSFTEGNPGLIIGASTYRIYRDGTATTPTARKSRDGSYTYDVYNTAIFSDLPETINCTTNPFW